MRPGCSGALGLHAGWTDVGGRKLEGGLDERRGGRGSVAFKWRFWKIQTHAESGWVLISFQGCRRKTSGISGIFLTPPTNLHKKK